MQVSVLKLVSTRVLPVKRFEPPKTKTSIDVYLFSEVNVNENHRSRL